MLITPKSQSPIEPEKDIRAAGQNDRLLFNSTKELYAFNL